MALSGMNHWQRACVVMGIVVFLVALMGGLLAAVVGGGGSLAVAASRSTGGGSSSGSGSGQLPAAVKAQAERSLVHASDLPSGWITAGTVSTSRTSPWSKELASCVGVPARIARIASTRLSSPSFGSADHTAAVEDTVSVYPSAAD